MNLEALNLKEMSIQESKETEGGVIHAVAFAAACGVGLGIIVVGCVVGYGIYRLVDWATK